MGMLLLTKGAEGREIAALRRKLADALGDEAKIFPRLATGPRRPQQRRGGH